MQVLQLGAASVLLSEAGRPFTAAGGFVKQSRNVPLIDPTSRFFVARFTEQGSLWIAAYL
jgi:hypothetical protein